VAKPNLKKTTIIDKANWSCGDEIDAEGDDKDDNVDA